MPDIVYNPPNLISYQVGMSPPDVIGLRLQTEDGTSFVARVKRGMVGPLVTEMIGRVSALPAEENEQRIETQPLSAIGAQTVVGPQGQPGIAIRLEGGLKLTIALTPAAIADLQTHLARIAQITAQPGGTSH